MIWEYKVLWMQRDFGLTSKLNELGADGWELIKVEDYVMNAYTLGVEPTYANVASGVLCYFKRLKGS